MKSFFAALDDLKEILFFSNSEREYAYAFIVHMRGIEDIYRKFSLLRFFPKSLTNFITKFMWPVTVSSISGLKEKDGVTPIPGFVIGIPLTAKKMLSDRNLALKKIKEAVLLAERKGAKIIGLGAMTASLSRGGTDLLETTNAYITTGHAYTVHNVTTTLLTILKEVGSEPKESIVAIVGASGSIGSNSARILADYPFRKMILIDVPKKGSQLETLSKDLKAQNKKLSVVVSTTINDIAQADLVITATSAPEALVRREFLSPGTIIVDDAQPSDIDGPVFFMSDVLVLEAGAVRTPGISTNFDIDLHHAEENFSCMAELLILAREHKNKHYGVGKITLEQIREIAAHGAELGFAIGEFQNLHEKISKEKITHIKNLRVR